MEPLTAKQTRYLNRGEIGRLSTEALVNLLAAWCVRNAETQRRIPRYLWECQDVLSKRLGCDAALSRVRVRCAQLVLVVTP